MEDNTAPRAPDKPNTTYKLSIDWPDFADSESGTCMRCDATELRRMLSMLPTRFGKHRIDSAPLMIEIHEVPK